MSKLRDYYERALQEFGIFDDGEFNDQESREVEPIHNIYCYKYYNCYLNIKY